MKFLGSGIKYRWRYGCGLGCGCEGRIGPRALGGELVGVNEWGWQGWRADGFTDEESGALMRRWVFRLCGATAFGKSHE